MSTQNAARRPEEEDVKSSGLKKVVTASMAGTVVEWYEFFLYASAATLVFGKLFFPNSGTELDGIIAAFVTYAVGFVARPIGGIVFGHFGDKFGRKHLLQLSIILVGVATFADGLPADVRPDRLLGTGPPGLPALRPGLRRRWRMGRRRPPRRRAQPQQVARLLVLAGRSPPFRWATCSPPLCCSPCPPRCPPPTSSAGAGAWPSGSPP